MSDAELIWAIDCTRCGKHAEAPPPQLLAITQRWHLQFGDGRVTAVVCDTCQTVSEVVAADENAKALDEYVAEETARIRTKGVVS